MKKRGGLWTVDSIYLVPRDLGFYRQLLKMPWELGIRYSQKCTEQIREDIVDEKCKREQWVSAGR